MNSKILKSGHIKLYKRENSKFWQMKIKLPKQKAIRSSSGTKILKEAEKIALNNYSLLNKAPGGRYTATVAAAAVAERTDNLHPHNPFRRPPSPSV